MTGKPHTSHVRHVLLRLTQCKIVGNLIKWSFNYPDICCVSPGGAAESSRAGPGTGGRKRGAPHPALPVAVTTCPHPHQTWGDHSHQSPHLHAFIHHDNLSWYQKYIHYSVVQSVKVLVSVNKASRWNMRYLRGFDGLFNVPKMIHNINWMAWGISVMRKLVVFTVLFWPGLHCTFNKFLWSNHFLKKLY